MRRSLCFNSVHSRAHELLTWIFRSSLDIVNCCSLLHQRQRQCSTLVLRFGARIHRVRKRNPLLTNGSLYKKIVSEMFLGFLYSHPFLRKTMAHEDAGKPPVSSKLVIRNIGLVLSGDLSHPILDADAVVVIDGRITVVGREKDIDTEGAAHLIDANGTALAPGLIDSHVHPVAGDWTPRQNQIGWIDSFLHGGVTTMISAGEVHMPGRPRDVVGIKAMAIFAQRAFWTLRPGGVKVHAGAPVIECEMVEDDFKDMAAAGVKLLGEVGLGGFKHGPTARKMVAWARKYAIQSPIPSAAPSIPAPGLPHKH